MCSCDLVSNQFVFDCVNMSNIQRVDLPLKTIEADVASAKETSEVTGTQTKSPLRNMLSNLGQNWEQVPCLLFGSHLFIVYNPVSILSKSQVSYSIMPSNVCNFRIIFEIIFH